MGALGPIGYAGPKGMKVKRARLSQAPMTYFSPDRRVPWHNIGGWEDGGTCRGMQAGQELGSSQA